MIQADHVPVPFFEVRDDKLPPCSGRLDEIGILKRSRVSLKSDHVSTASEQSSVMEGVKKSTRSTSIYRQDVICIFGENGEVSNCIKNF